MLKSPYNFKPGSDNPVRNIMHWWTHRRSGTELICDAVILALGAIILDFMVLFVSLVVDSFAIEREPPALIAGLGAILVRALVVGAVVVGGIGFVRFAREGADTMNRPKRDANETSKALTVQHEDQRDAA